MHRLLFDNHLKPCSRYYQQPHVREEEIFGIFGLEGLFLSELAKYD